MISALRSVAGCTALVTGGLGMVGRAITRVLSENGAKVRILDSLLPQGGGTTGLMRELGDRIDITIDDTRSREAVNRLVQGCDLIFHCAGIDGLSAPSVDWYSEVDIACIGTLHVLDAARIYAPHSHVVFLSAAAVYGNRPSWPVREEEHLKPVDLFGIHKLAGERYAAMYTEKYGIQTTSARLSTIYGPGQRLRGVRAPSLANFIDSARNNEAIRLPSRTEWTIDTLFVNDAAIALVGLAALRKENSSFIVNVGGGSPKSAEVIAHAVIAAANSGTVEMVPSSKRFRGAPPLDNTRLRQMLPWWSTTSLEVGLAETMRWYRGTNSAC